MTMLSRPFASIDELHTHELACLEKMAHSNVAMAIPGALHYCQKHRVAIPTWLAKSATDLLCRELTHKTSGKRGRSSGALARNRQDMIDYARWDEVMTIREKQLELLAQTRQLRLRTESPKALLNEHEKMLAWVGRSLIRAYECASLILQDTPAFGGPEAIKRSYLKVRRSQKDPSQAFRHHLMDPEFRQSLGLIVHLSQRKDVHPLHELELEN